MSTLHKEINFEDGGGEVREKEKIWLAEIIKKVNEIFGSETTDGDQLA